MSQHPYFMEIHANHRQAELMREVAREDAMKHLRAHKSSAQSANTPLVDRPVTTIDVEGFSRSLRCLVRSWKLTLHGRAVA